MNRSVVCAAPLLFSVGLLACNGLLGITQLDGADGGAPSDGSAPDTAPDTAGDAESDVLLDDAADVDPSCAGLPDPGPMTTCYPRPSGLVSWWRAERNTTDSAGPNDGTMTNVGYVPGYVGQAFHFNGNGYVTAPAAGLPVGSDDRTMEAWVRPTVSYPSRTAKQGLFFGYGTWRVYNVVSALLDCPTNSGNSVLFTQWGEQVGGGNIEPGVWRHVAMTLSRGSVRVYLDGSLVAKEQLGWAINTAPGGITYLGGLPDPPDTSVSWLSGDVDEAAVYSRALCPQEVAGIVAAGHLGKCP